MFNLINGKLIELVLETSAWEDLLQVEIHHADSFHTSHTCQLFSAS